MEDFNRRKKEYLQVLKKQPLLVETLQRNNENSYALRVMLDPQNEIELEIAAHTLTLMINAIEHPDDYRIGDTYSY